MGQRSASRNLRHTAYRGGGTSPKTARAMCGTSKPETRTTAIPPSPGGVAKAAMVADAFTGGKSVALRDYYLIDAPLLQNRQDIVDHPVEHKARREEQKH